MTQTSLKYDRRTADEVQEMTVDQAAALPGLLGRIAPAMLKAHGEYGYTETETGRKVLIVRKAA